MFSIPFAARMFLSKWWPVIAAGVVIAIAIGVIYSRGFSAGKTGEELKAAQREVQVQTDVGVANENSSVARVQDATTLQTQAQEIKDATRDSKTLDDARARRGCVILRQQGRDTSRIPACR